MSKRSDNVKALVIFAVFAGALALVVWWFVSSKTPPEDVGNTTDTTDTYIVHINPYPYSY